MHKLMMSRYKHLIFVCVRERSADAKSGSCARRGSNDLLARIQAWIKERGLKKEARAVSSGCLNMCAKGCTAVIYSASPQNKQPTETWYTGLNPDQAEPWLESHIAQGKPYAGHHEEMDLSL